MKRATDLLSRLGLAVAPRLAPTELEGDVARLVPREYADLVGLDAYADAMGELKSLSEKHGFPVVMVARGGRREVRPICARLGIPIVTTATRLMRYMREHGIDRYAGSALTVSEQDVHPSALGHRIIAEAVFEHMRDTGLCRALVDRVKP